MSYLASVSRLSTKFVPIVGFRNFRVAQCMSQIFLNIVNSDDFTTKVMRSKIPVIVNFHADWCEPCHILTPKLKELVGTKDSINLAVIDVEKYPELVQDFEVKAVPAVVAIKDGIVVDKFIGLVEAPMIEKLINKLEE